MPRDLVIGVDCSTTATKAIAWDAQGRLIAAARRPHTVSMPRPGWHEQPAAAWWAAACAALTELAGQLDTARLAGLAISHQRETFAPVDAAGEPLRPAILWMDERPRSLLPRLAAQFGRQHFHELTGKPLSGNLSISKIAWLAEHEPDLCAQTAYYLDTHAFLVHRLTGQYRTGWGSADPTGLFDMRRAAWSEELLAGVGARLAQMPDLYPPGAVLGAITPDAARQCGLPAGLPVICGLGDGQAAGLGAGVTGPGLAYLNLGTAVIGGAHSAVYTADPAFRTTCSGVPGAYVLETVLLGGAYTVAWFLSQFGTPALPDEAAWEAAGADLPPGAEGLMLVPYWNSAMNPYWDAAASGVVVGWRGVHGPRHLYRAILEGVAFELRLHMAGVGAALAARGGAPVHGFVAVGGGSRSAVWRQIIADVTGLRVYPCATAEASALGAGVLAAVGAGLYPDAPSAARRMAAPIGDDAAHPDPARHAVYTRLYEDVYRHLFPALQPALDRLADLVAGEGGAAAGPVQVGG